jgi:PAS domain S-box-containing protein
MKSAPTEAIPARECEKRLEKLRQEYDTIFNSIYDEIFIADGQGTIIFVNKACERLYNMRSDQLIGRNVRDLEREGVFSPSVTGIVLRTKKAETIVQSTHDGRRILVTAIPIKDERGELLKIVSNSRDMTELMTLRRELDEKDRLIRQYTQQIRKLTAGSVDELLYASKQMESVHNLINKVAASDLSILLLGESGVGKTMIANVIHNLSGRKNGPFQVINCSAIPETLLESELFGYVKGAFTGATSQGKAGLFELAKGGTIFLDEIGDISPQLQVKLLQVIQDRKFRKIGGVAEIAADFRIVTATNQSLEKKIKAKQFREDLFYRINGISILIPPLRDRREDIGVLSHAFLEEVNKKYGRGKKLSSDILDTFYNYPWPGNIRELKSLVERLCLVAEDDLIMVEDLPANMLPYARHRRGGRHLLADNIYPLKQALEMVERDLFAAAYVKYRSSYKIAQALGISQPTAFRKLRRYVGQFKDE